MKYAIPVSGGMVSTHFGHCEQFALIEVDEAKKQILKKEMVNSPRHEPGLLPPWLAEKGVSLVIAGGMGSRAQSLFQQNRIGVITGIMDSNPEKAVLSHMNGVLARGANICDH
jgi:ATP-binding protein involved in chromosome partitioning